VWAIVGGDRPNRCCWDYRSSSVSVATLFHQAV
jgi:hypothetical protein